MNFIQRIGIALSAIALITVVVLHNPFEGYITSTVEKWFEEEPKLDTCNKAEFSEYKELNKNKSKTGEPTGKHQLPEKYKSRTRKKEDTHQFEMIGREFELFIRCFDISNHERIKTLPLDQWRSVNPALPWFASTLHSLVAAFAILLGGMIWTLVLRTPTTHRKT